MRIDHDCIESQKSFRREFYTKQAQDLVSQLNTFVAWNGRHHLDEFKDLTPYDIQMALVSALFRINKAETYLDVLKTDTYWLRLFTEFTDKLIIGFENAKQK